MPSCTGPSPWPRRHRALLIVLAFVATIQAGHSAAQTLCSGTELVIMKSGGPHAGVSCTGLSGFSIILEDGATVETTEGTGISLGGSGDISITTRPTGGYSRVVSSQDSGTGPNEKYRAISVVGNSVMQPGTLNIAVTDVWARGEGTDAIWVSGYRGEVVISSTGSIRVDGTAPAFGIEIDNTNANSAAHTTTIKVNDIVSHASADPNATNDVAALRIRSFAGVSVFSRGLVHTTGSFSHGVQVIQNIDADSHKPVSITVNDVTTEGPGSYGVNAETLNFNRLASPIDVLVNGRVETYGWESHGLALAGPDARINVVVARSGSIIANEPTGPWDSYFLDEPPKYAVVALKRSGPRRVESATLTNRGQIRGDVKLESCVAPQFTNLGTFVPRRNIILDKVDCSPVKSGRTAGILENSGTIKLGAPGETSGILMTGDLELSASSNLMIDVDWGAETADLLTITGSAKLGGQLLVNSMSLPTEDKEVAILDASEDVDGIPGVTIRRSLFLDYFLRSEAVGTRERVFLSARVNQNPGKLNQNQRNVFAEIRNSRDNNASINDALVGLINLTDIESLRHDLDSFGNEIAGASIQSAFHASGLLAGAMPHCIPRTGPTLRKCSWISAGSRRFERDRSWPQRDYRNTGHDFGSGFVLQSNESDLRLGFGLGQRRSHLTLAGFAQAEGTSLIAGASLAGNLGRFRYSLSTTLGSTEYSISRRLPSVEQVTWSKGMFKSSTIGLHGIAAWDSRLGNYQVSPFARLDSVRIKSRPYVETGAGDLSLEVMGTDTDLTVVGFGMELNAGPFNYSGLALTPTFSAALNRTIDGSIVVHSDFRGGIGTYQSTTSLLPTSIDLEVAGKIRSRTGKQVGKLSLETAWTNGSGIYRTALAGNIVFRF